LLAVLVLVGLVSLLFLVHPYYDVVWDGSVYLATADALLKGEGYSYLEMPYRIRPPGLSLLLSTVLAVSGRDHLALNTLMSLCGLLAVVLLFVHQRPRVGGPLALLASFAIWFNPGFQKYATQMLSDVPGLALALACLLLARWCDRRPTLGREVALGVCIGLATYMRTALVLLLPALWLARLVGSELSIHGSWKALWPFVLRRILPVGTATLLVMLPWSLRNAALAPDRAVDQFVIYDYATAQWHTSWTDPEAPLLSPFEVLARSEERSYQLVKSLGSRMQWGTFSEEPVRRAFDARESFVTALLVLSLCVIAWRRRDPSSFFALGTLAVLLIYFDFHARLALPVYVLSFASFVEVGRDLADRLMGPGRGVLLVGLVTAAVLVWDFDPGRGWEDIEAKDLDLQERCLSLERIATDEARLATTIGSHYSMCLSRPVFGIAQRVFMDGDAAAAEGVIDRHEVDTVFLDPTSRYDVRFARYFRLVYGPPERLGILQHWRVRSPRRTGRKPRRRESAPMSRGSGP
jgi:4-amino-4-deoxy-L-arabinose transferase-like glycosyltransferase